MVDLSLVEFSDGFLFLDGLNSVELDLTLGSLFETTNLSSQLFVVVEVVSEGSHQIVKFRLILNRLRVITSFLTSVKAKAAAFLRWTS